MIGSARYWREIPQRYRYEAARCAECSKLFFPPRTVCSNCRGRRFEKATLPKEGEIETFTVDGIRAVASPMYFPSGEGVAGVGVAWSPLRPTVVRTGFMGAAVTLAAVAFIIVGLLL